MLAAPTGPWGETKALWVSVLSPCLKEGFQASGEISPDSFSSVKPVPGDEALAAYSVLLGVTTPPLFLGLSVAFGLQRRP